MPKSEHGVPGAARGNGSAAREVTHGQTQVHVLSFEGIDRYARAGGLATRVSGLSEALASLGLETHLWFVGDPDEPGREDRGSLKLHRWCQWISRAHPAGVYDGEEAKQADYAASLPPFLVQESLLPHLRSGGNALVLAEEWHTVHAVLHLDWLLRKENVRERVRILWNANNVFGFERIDWPRLCAAATVTTVSRYMKHLMWRYQVDPLVIPNGLSPEAFVAPDRRAVAALRRMFEGRVVLTKIARFDPDKRWLLAVDTIGELKRHGLRPILIARGGMEAHGREVMASAAAAGLHVRELSSNRAGAEGLLEALRHANGADMVHLGFNVDAKARAALFRAAGAVLANSGHEPFGLVGLEAMAAGGVACTGCTGEDYALAGRNAVVLQTSEPSEFVGLLQELLLEPQREQALRRAGRTTARGYAWPAVIQESLKPRLNLLRA